MDNLEEFSWHTDSVYKECIETNGREMQSILSNCWAIALASVIGDAYCIKNNLKAIYPSSMWITSFLNDYYMYSKDEEIQIIAEGSELGSDLAKIFFYFLLGKDMKLEKCYPQNESIKKFKGEKLINSELPKCCLECLMKKNENDKTYSCDPTLTTLTTLNCSSNNEIYNFNIRITQFYYHRKYENFDSAKKNIKNNINMIKYKIRCHGPILTDINETDEYTSYKKRIKNMNIQNIEDLENIPIFKPTKKGKVDDDGSHAVSVVGWGRNFWWVRDPHLKFFIKMSFPTYDNFLYYPGPFYDNDEYKDRNISRCYYVAFDVAEDTISIYNMIRRYETLYGQRISNTMFISSILYIMYYIFNKKCPQGICQSTIPPNF